MHFKLPQLFLLFLVCCTAVIYPGRLAAQNIDDDAVIRDTTSAFYKQLSGIIKQIDTHFDKAKDELVDTTGQKTWSCKESYKLDGARSCAVMQKGFNTIYVAFFLSRESKDALESSYHNLCHQLKDCMGANYDYKEKKASTADMLLRRNNYACEMTPNHDSAPDQADMLVTVEKDSQTGNYELILEIQKYKGYY